MIIERIPAGSYQTNCYIIECENSKECAIIDPAGSLNKILEYIKSRSLLPKYIILTHGHGDHIGAVEELKELYNIDILIHKEDEYMINDRNANLSSLMGKGIEFKSDKNVADGECIKVGHLILNFIHTPGHTKGSMCILADNVIFTGDTLFANSIGRTDLEGGSYDQIIKSIKEKLVKLDENIKVLPGHGPASSIGVEKTTNPFIK